MLVDLNHASAEIMASALELAPEQAAEIAQARAELDGFASLSEVAAFTSLPIAVVDRLQERAVFVAR